MRPNIDYCEESLPLLFKNNNFKYTMELCSQKIPMQRCACLLVGFICKLLNIKKVSFNTPLPINPSAGKFLNSSGFPKYYKFFCDHSFTLENILMSTFSEEYRSVIPPSLLTTILLKRLKNNYLARRKTAEVEKIYLFS